MLAPSPTAARRVVVRAKHRRLARRPSTATISPAELPAQSLASLIAEYSAIFSGSWKPVTVRKHRDDFARFHAWLAANDIPETIATLEFGVLARYVQWLRERPKVSGVWRG